MTMKWPGMDRALFVPRGLSPGGFRVPMEPSHTHSSVSGGRGWGPGWGRSERGVRGVQAQGPGPGAAGRWCALGGPSRPLAIRLLLAPRFQAKHAKIGEVVTLTVYRDGEAQDMQVTVGGTTKTLGSTHKVKSRGSVSHNIRYQKPSMRQPSMASKPSMKR